MVHTESLGRRFGQRELWIWGIERDFNKGNSEWQLRFANRVSRRELFNANHMSPSDMSSLLSRLDANPPQLIVSGTQAAYEIGLFAAERGIRIRPQRGLISTAETLHDFMRQEIEEVFGCPVYDRYGSREVGDIAGQCREREGLHVFPWSVYLEIVDDEGQRVPAGTPGNVLVTSLANFAMLLIRYAIGDRATLATETACPCGRQGQKLSEVRGRATDMFRCEDGTVVDYGGLIELLYFRPWVRRFQIIQHEYSRFEFLVELNHGLEPAASELDEIRAGVGEEWGTTAESSLGSSTAWKHQHRASSVSQSRMSTDGSSPTDLCLARAQGKRRAGPLSTLLLFWREARSLLTNSLNIMGTTVVTSLLGYVYWVLAARLYSPSAVGLAAALLSAMSLAALLTYMGVGATVIQLLSGRTRGPDRSRLVTAAVLTTVVSGTLGGIVLVVVLPALSAQFDLLRASPWVSLVLAFGVLCTSLGTLVDDTTVAQRTARGMLMRNTAFSLIKIGILVLPLCVALGAGGVLLSWVVGAAATVVAGLLLLPRLVPGFKASLKGVIGEVRKIVRELAGNHLITLGGMVPILMLPVLVTIRLNATQAGYFYTTWRVGGLFFMVSPAVASALFAEGAHDPADVARKARSRLALSLRFLSPRP